MDDGGQGAMVEAARSVRVARSGALETIWGGLGASSDALGLCAAASAATDEAARACWDMARMPPGCALMAVGGYGRAALWPGSDVDVLALASDESEGGPSEADLDAAVGRLAAAMWDAGLDPGLVSRRVGDCAGLAGSDVTIRCSMMERRLVAGCPRAADGLGAALAGMAALPFYLAKMREQSERHARQGDSPFGLEPNVKEAPGGLRDLQMPMWVARSMGIEATWQGLARAGLLTGGEAELASACEGRLALLRAMLHRQGKARGDRLDFASQAALAKGLGIGMEEGKSAAAVMMDGFFACARSAVMINEVLLQGMSERLLDAESGPCRPLSERFYERGGLLWAVSDDVFAKEPSALFEAFEWMQRDPTLDGMGSRCTRALWRASRRVDSWFRADQGNREAFARMLSRESRVVGELSRMARVGLLGAYLPAFGKAETLMQHDLFHAYTVGRHTLGVVRNLRRFRREDRAHEMPQAFEIATGFDGYWLLYVGALFHDIAKGRGGRHEEKGVEDAEAFCAQHGVSGEDAELVSFLVRWHLEMSRTSQKEDVDDPQVAERFATLCGTQRRLDALYLLTVADMKATGPSVWSDWKGGLLASLWRQASLVLAGGQAPAAGRARQRRAAAFESARQAAGEDRARAYVEGLDDLYFMRASDEDCAWHARELAGLERSQAACVAELSGDRARVAVWSRAEGGLFAKICSALSRAGLGVDSAKVATRWSGWALVWFEALDSRSAGDPAARAEEIKALVLAAIAPGAPAPAPSLGRCSARAQHAGAVARAKVAPAGSDWLVEIACANRSGVLWTIADVFDRRGVQVKSARVATVGERAEDVFVVGPANLSTPEARAALESELSDRLGL